MIVLIYHGRKEPYFLSIYNYLESAKRIYLPKHEGKRFTLRNYY